MDSNRNRWLLLGVATTLISAACFWFGTGLNPLWWLRWLAPLPVLWLAARVRASAAALAAAASVLIAVGNQWVYLHDYIRLPLPVVIVSATLMAAIFTAVVLLYRRLALRGQLFAAMFSVPLLWTAIAFGSAAASPHGTWGDIAYTQMNALPVIQIAALTGLWGIGFVVMLGAACLAVLCSGAPARSRWRPATIGAVLVALAIGYGFWRLFDDPASGSATIGLISLQSEKPEVPTEPGGEALIARYLAAAGQLADAGAQYVVLPEVTLKVSQSDVTALHEFAQRRAITLLVGADLNVAGAPERNASLVFDARGGVTTYNKQHLVPMFEDRFVAGSGTTLLDGTRVGLTICKDNDFPALGRAYGERDAQLLLVPAWDFRLDDWLHSRMAILRGVESGFAMARSAREGRLTLSDDRGRVLAEVSSVARDAQLVATLPLRNTHTLYARWGDWFAWLCVAALGVVLWQARPRRRTRAHSLQTARSG